MKKAEDGDETAAKTWKYCSSLKTEKTDHSLRNYFAVYNTHIFAQSLEGKIRMHIIHG